MRKPSSQQAKQLATSILEYLAGYERYAAMRNDRSMVHHFQDCWCVVFTQFYGAYSLPRLQVSRSITYEAEMPPQPKPQWHIAKYSRPARKVVAQVIERHSEGKRRESVSILYDVLVCGHKLQAGYKENGSRVSKWRYCNECEPSTSTASSDRTMDSAAA